MPHLTPLSDDQAPAAAKPLFQILHHKLGMVPNIYRTMGHKPEVLEACLKMDAALQENLPGKLRELAYLKASDINECAYRLKYHRALGQRAGLTHAQIDALADFETGDLFDAHEKAVLRFADQLTRQAKVDAAVVEELKRFLNPAQLVVLAAAVGQADFTNRFNHAFDVELP